MKIPKKIPKTRAEKFNKLKNLFPALFLARTGCDKLKKGEKNLVSNSVHTQSGEENSEENFEKNFKKIQKIKKPLFGIISRQIGMW